MADHETVADIVKELLDPDTPTTAEMFTHEYRQQLAERLDRAHSHLSARDHISSANFWANVPKIAPK